MLSRSTPRACGAGVLLLGLLAFTVGCGGEDLRARATVKGKVSIGAKNLTAGTVRFVSVKNEAYTGSASIDKNGNYVMSDAPLGDVKVSVYVPPQPPGGINRMKMGQPMTKDKKEKDKGTESVNPEDPSKRIAIMGSMPDHIVSIPDKYGTPETSGLTFTVKRGEQTHDIPLTP